MSNLAVNRARWSSKICPHDRRGDRPRSTAICTRWVSLCALDGRDPSSCFTKQARTQAQSRGDDQDLVFTFSDLLRYISKSTIRLCATVKPPHWFPKRCCLTSRGTNQHHGIGVAHGRETCLSKAAEELRDAEARVLGSY